jgi:hypothetical protein
MSNNCLPEKEKDMYECEIKNCKNEKSPSSWCLLRQCENLIVILDDNVCQAKIRPFPHIKIKGEK